MNGFRPIPYSLFPTFDQSRKLRLDFLAQVESHAELRLNLPRPVHEQQDREVLDVVAPSECLSGRAAEIYMDKLDFLSPRSFEPMHDGPGRLAAQSEVGIKVQEADAASVQPRVEVLRRAERSRLLAPPDGHGPYCGHERDQSRPRGPRGREAAQDPGCQDKPNAGSDEQGVPGDQSVNRVNGSSSFNRAARVSAWATITYLGALPTRSRSRL